MTPLLLFAYIVAVALGLVFVGFALGVAFLVFLAVIGAVKPRD